MIQILRSDLFEFWTKQKLKKLPESKSNSKIQNANRMRISGRQMEKRQNGQIRQKYFECCRTRQKLVCSQPKRRQKKRKILLWKSEGRNRSNCKINSTIATSNVKICSDEFIGCETLVLCNYWSRVRTKLHCDPWYTGPSLIALRSRTYRLIHKLLSLGISLYFMLDLIPIHSVKPF